MEKNGYSRNGFFRETIHYDANEKKVGESSKNSWGGYDHFDASRKKNGTSREGFFDSTNHYYNNGNKTAHRRQGFCGGTNHYGSGSSIRHSVFDDDPDAIQDEVDNFDDPDEAVAWLEAEGYDPSDFDL